MERLTFDGNFCDIAKCDYSPCFCGKCTQKVVWERLKEFEDAEEQGRLVVLQNSTMISDSNEALRRAMWYLNFKNNGVNRYIADAVAEKLVRDEAVAAKMKEKDAGGGTHI